MKGLIDEEKSTKRRKKRKEPIVLIALRVILYGVVPICAVGGMIYFGSIIATKITDKTETEREIINFSAAEVNIPETITPNSGLSDEELEKLNQEMQELIAEAQNNMSSGYVPNYNYSVLQQQVPYAAGYINIVDTNIQYPIMWSADDPDYYVNHSSNGSINANGSIFLDSQNKSDFSDNVNILFGHNIVSGLMFRHLNDYVSTAGYLDSHKTVYIVTEAGTDVYTVVSAKVVEPSQIYDIYDVDSANALMGTNIPEGSKILVMVTCYTQNNANRVCVVAYKN